MSWPGTGRRPRSRTGRSISLAVGALMSLVVGLFAAGGLVPAVANASTPAPSINSWTVTPKSLPYTGGTITLAADVNNAFQCTFSTAGAGNTQVTGLPKTVSCGTAVTVTATVKQNTKVTSTSFPIYLLITGPGGVFTPGAKSETEMGLPLPSVSSFKASPNVMTYRGGNTTVSVAVTNATNCTFTSSVKVPGLPTTVPCSSGTASVTVNLPTNVGPQPAYYGFVVRPVGYGPARPAPAPVLVTVNPAPSVGYWLVGADGGILSYGERYFGSMGGKHINDPVVGLAATPDAGGYWEVASDGGIFAFGDAVFYGSMGGKHLNAPIVGMASTPDGKGYWLVATDGGIFTFGDAPFDGSMGGKHLTQSIVGMAVDPATGGYWMVAADGGVFSFNAPFEGTKPANEIVGMSSTPDGGGYWLVGSDGTVLNFGDAGFFGSLGPRPYGAPLIVGIDSSVTGLGYYVADADGGVFDMGNATPYSGTGNLQLNAPIVAISSPGVF